MLHYNIGEQYPQLLATQQRKRFQQTRSRHLQPDDTALLLQQQPPAQQPEQQQPQQKKPVRIFRVHYLRINSKDGCGGLSKSSSLTNLSTSAGASSCNGIGAINAATNKMKTIAPNIRRRRRCDKHHLELAATAAAAATANSATPGLAHGASISMPASVCSSATASTATSPIEDIALPAPPITPPPAFLSAGYKRSCAGASSKAATGPAAGAKLSVKTATTANQASQVKLGGAAGGATAVKPSGLKPSPGGKVLGMRRMLGM
ncbi:uncharacterized protein LOC125778630 isoform X1 [Bactrocera dorsalis]|uniref:Uncharacterized protein LOC125778630 isoform X1 n=1 Tax=Bactrocera dorsalis TaxID=27457 RepID=A0ABM3JVP5_BACDO|nr:uncharacterized protein LOC125778630 isoform X1 [Bactrocera dorsalis]